MRTFSIQMAKLYRDAENAFQSILNWIADSHNSILLSIDICNFDRAHVHSKQPINVKITQVRLQDLFNARQIFPLQLLLGILCWLRFKIAPKKSDSFEIMNISQKVKLERDEKKKIVRKTLHSNAQKRRERNCVFFVSKNFCMICVEVHLLFICWHQFGVFFSRSLVKCFGCWEKVKVGKCTFPALCSLYSVYPFHAASQLVVRFLSTVNSLEKLSEKLRSGSSVSAAFCLMHKIRNWDVCHLQWNVLALLKLYSERLYADRVISIFI